MSRSVSDLRSMEDSLSTGESLEASALSADAQMPPDVALEGAKRLALELDRDSGRRKAIPVRKSFVRNDSEDQKAPLAQLIAAKGGRGGVLPVKLYLALIWRCSREPYDTNLSARKWAALLGLDDPNAQGARRVAKALRTLEENRLVVLEKRRGEPSKITLLDESGDESPYHLPSTRSSQDRLSRDRYFKVNSKLWTEGLIQQMNAPALGMLLVLLAEQGGEPGEHFELFKTGKEVWWSTELFPLRYNLTASMRSRGTKELTEAGLLQLRKRSVGPNGSSKNFTSERVRNVYVLCSHAVVPEDKEKAVPPTRKAPKGGWPKAAAKNPAATKARMTTA